MSRLGAAVHVITTAGPGGKTGATATAVCSVSDAPPTLLMCLNRRSQTNPVVLENGVFCVNTLGAGEAEIADIFAGRTGVMGSDRFNKGEWTTLLDRQSGAGERRGRVRLPDRRGALGRRATTCSSARWKRCGSVRRVRRSSITSARTSGCELARSQVPCATNNRQIQTKFPANLRRARLTFLS